jgi:hypothetical protein
MFKILSLYIKTFLKRIIQRIYDRVAPPDFTLFDLVDTNDPLFGAMTGTPSDRRLIASFLEKASIQNFNLRGYSLEIGSSSYLQRYWPLTERHQLDFKPNESFTNISKGYITGDLRVPSPNHFEKFELICLTQVLNFIDDYEAALSTIASLLSTTGRLVATFPFLVPLSIFDDSKWGEWKKFTPREVELLAKKYFPNSEICVFTLGNAVTTASMILGIPSEKLDNKFFEFDRPSHATVIGLTVQKRV